MTWQLPPKVATFLTGHERFKLGTGDLPCSLHDFWRWSESDLLDNTTRGVLAEFIVAQALEIPLVSPRESWAVFDLTTPEGIRVEVKSAAYLQAWAQRRPSVVTFSIRKTRAWNPETNMFEGERRRHADVYVFALLAHLDKNSVDPLDLQQWSFFVVSTPILDKRERSQHSITLPSLKGLDAGPYPFEQLRERVRDAARPG